MRTERQRSILLIQVAFTLIFIGFGFVGPVLPFLARQLGASATELGLALTLYSFGQFVTAPIWGSLSERWGRKPVLVASLAGLGVSTVAVAWAVSWGQILALRLLGGLISGAVLPACYALMADLSDQRERATALGRLTTASGVGMAAGPLVGGLLGNFGATVPFWISGGVALMVALVIALVLQAPGPAPMAARPVADVPRPQVAAQLLESPIIRPLVIIFLMHFAGVGFFSMSVLFAADVLGANPTQASLVFVVMGASAMAAQSPPLRRLRDRVGLVATVCGGLAMAAMGYVILISTVTLVPSLVGVALASVGWYAANPIIVSIVSIHSPFGQGMTMGIENAVESLARVMAPVWAGSIYAWSARGPVWNALVLLCVGSLLAIRLANLRLENQPER